MEVGQIAGLERSHQQHGGGDARVPNRKRLLQLDDRESAHLLERRQNPGDRDNSESVPVVLDDGKDRTVTDGGATAATFRREVLGFDLDPRIEAGISRGRLWFDSNTLPRSDRHGRSGRAKK